MSGQPAGRGIPFSTLDANGDGKVTLEEMRASYRSQGVGPVLTPASFVPGDGSQELTRRLFTILDTNRDGKLSRAELQAAETALAAHDTSDDELVSMSELGFTPNRLGLRITAPVPVTAAARLRGTSAVRTNLLLIPRGTLTPNLQLAREVIARLDTNEDGKLTLEESRFPREMFVKYDRNGDGRLDVLECVRWTNSKPEAEFTAELRTRPGKPGQPRPQEKASTRGLMLDSVRLTIQAQQGPEVPAASMRDTLLLQFQQADRENKKLVTKPLANTSNTYLLHLHFDLADGNGDGKLTLDELKEFLEFLDEASLAQLTLSVAATGQGMFQMLDANNDGQLSIRERRNAWQRLQEFDQDGDGHISRSEFPREVSLMVGRVPVSSTLPRLALLRERQTLRRPTAPARGPVWFRKMDRNGDGDVSPLEWLGTRETFDRIDTNRDGLLSLDEAEAADPRVRKNKD